MGLEQIKQEIEQQATAREQEILGETTKKIAELRAKAAEQQKQLEAEAAQKRESEKRALENRELSLVNMEAQKMLFDAKKHALDTVYRDVYAKIKKMQKKERDPLMQTLLQKANKEIDVAVAYTNEADVSLIQTDTCEVRAGEVDGGLICETKDGTVRVDHTFEAIFQGVKEKTMKGTSKTLFG